MGCRREERQYLRVEQMGFGVLRSGWLAQGCVRRARELAVQRQMDGWKQQEGPEKSEDCSAKKEHAAVQMWEGFQRRSSDFPALALCAFERETHPWTFSESRAIAFCCHVFVAREIR